MIHFRTNPIAPDPDTVRHAADILLGGGIIAYPTDTLYGLAVDPRNEDAVERLFRVKGRVADQAIPLIAADVSQVEQKVASLTPLARRLGAVFWPGPLTLVLTALPSIVAAIHAGTGRVAVRVPGNEVARALAEQCGFAITSTSANLSGQNATSEPGEVVEALATRIDAILDAGATAGGLPSTIVDATGDVPVLVRAGVVPWERVLECL